MVLRATLSARRFEITRVYDAAAADGGYRVLVDRLWPRGISKDRAGLDTLVSQTGAVAADVRGGNLGAAKAAWLTAHLTYERLGTAYDAFGDFDQEIDGRPDGLAGGVSSARWTLR